MENKYQYIGKSVQRHDGYEKVTGTAPYVADLKMNGLLHARVKTSPYAHANILSVDIKKAEALPGVRAVITGRQGANKLGIYMQDRSIIATDKVRHFGEVVAAVAAVDAETAQRAVDLIEVGYEPLPAVLDVREAVKSESPLVHEKLGEYAHVKGVFFPIPGTNVASHIKIRKGNTEEAFKKADLIIENTYEQPQVFHIPLETHGTIVQWGIGDKIKIYSSSQSPFSIRDLFSVAFNLPKTDIEVNVPYVGGGFGGKSGIHMEPLVGLLSKAAGGQPVKLIPMREEECSTLPCRQGLIARIKTGVTKEGRIIAEEVEYLWDAGAYADYGVNIGRAGAVTGCGPYDIENVKVDSKTVYTNHVFGTAYRGFGHPEVFFGIERQRDLIAKALHMDPMELRLKNLLMPGSKTITGELITENTGRVDLCLKQVAESIGLDKPYTEEEKAEWRKMGKYRGKAAAVLQKSPAMPTWSASSALLQMNEDGTMRLSVGGVDYGQGTYTVMKQIVAERLHFPIEKIGISHSINTNLSPYDWQTVASRMTVLCGVAVIEACDDLKEQILEMGSVILRAAKHEIELEDEYIYVKQNPHERVHLSKLAMGYTFENGNAIGGPLIGRGKSIAQGLTNLDAETGQGKTALDWTYGAHAVEIEVDSNTGDIDILHMASSLDIGQVMNAALLRGQVVGGALQGIGTTFYEAVYYDDKGRLITRNFTDYKIPTFKDVPKKVDVMYVETPQMDGPYGARGCGEHPLISVTSVIANALANATGEEFFDLPLSADRVYLRLHEKKRG
ncbi:MAG TPA: xanthine dehydrogenase family protein molybdopterin-binding subunit [Clostridia bacterium]|nr:xanthine dehydrogenase family protein molybdopterin-binding subunit [Clostridia bacterium]